MKLVAALLLGVTALCGCSVPMGRSAAAGGSAPLATCSRAGGETPHGGMACIAGSQHRCANGAWQPTALRCEP